jgi:hypothetical protein
MESVRIVPFDVMRKINKCHRMSALTITITVEPSEMLPPLGDSTLVLHKGCHCVAQQNACCHMACTVQDTLHT